MNRLTSNIQHYASGSASATWIAAILLLLGSRANQLFESTLNNDATSVSLQQDALEELPLELGDWTGYADPLSPALASATDSDLQLSRAYVLWGSGPIHLFIGYGGRLRDLTRHRPEVCFPGAGWTLRDSQRDEIALNNGGSLSCRISHFGRGGFNQDQAAAISYYICNGSYIADSSQLSNINWYSPGAPNYWARIQITAKSSFAWDNIDERVRQFAAVSAPEIFNLLEAAAKKAIDPMVIADPETFELGQ